MQPLHFPIKCLQEVGLKCGAGRASGVRAPHARPAG